MVYECIYGSSVYSTHNTVAKARAFAYKFVKRNGDSWGMTVDMMIVPSNSDSVAWFVQYVRVRHITKDDEYVIGAVNGENGATYRLSASGKLGERLN